MPPGSVSAESRLEGGAISRHDVNDAVWHHDDFPRWVTLQPARYLGQIERRIFDRRVVAVAGKVESRAQLTVDLHRDRHLVVTGQLGIGGRPGLFRKEAGAPQGLPHLLGEVRHHWSEQSGQGFKTLAKHLRCPWIGGGKFVERVRQLSNPRDRPIEPELVEIVRHRGYRL